MIVAVVLDFGLGGAPTLASTSRKAHRTRPMVTMRDVAPDQTATIPPKPAPKPAATSAKAESDEVLPPPFHLPAASRARMRDCGEKWQEMKMAGQIGDEIWRTFATRCLATDTGPFDQRALHSRND